MNGKNAPKDYRFQSSLILWGLDRTSRLLSWPLFFPLHEAARLSHSALTRRLVQWRLGRTHKVQVALRHSQTERGNYHVLLSDVDISVIVEDNHAPESIPSLLEAYSRLRRTLPFLGEIEIYTQTEFQEKQRLEEKHCTLLSFIRSIRKFAWIESSENRPYHSLKAKRSLRQNESRLQKLQSEPHLHFLVTRFGTEVNAATPSENLRSYLGAGAKRVHRPLLTILEHIVPSWRVDTQSPLEFQMLKRDLMKWEAIQARAKGRLSSIEERERLYQWAEVLDEGLSEFDHLLTISNRRLSFSLYGIHIEVNLHSKSTASRSTFEDIRFEFQHFMAGHSALSVEAADTYKIEIDLLETLARERTSKVQANTAIGRVLFFKNQREVFTPEGSHLHLTFNKRHSLIKSALSHASDSSVVINGIHAIAGEFLERKGWVRLHAAAVSTTKGATVFWAPSGAGKSHLIASHLHSSTQGLLGDEVVWVDNQTIYPYPIPIALKNPIENLGTSRTRLFCGSQKTLIQIPSERISSPKSMGLLVVVLDGGLISLRWLFSLVMGFGLPQMWVYRVRRDTWLELTVVAYNRLKFGLTRIRLSTFIATSKATFRGTDWKFES